MLVVGDGKSTLIDALHDPNQSAAPFCGRNPEGVTKAMVLYRCQDLDGVPFSLIDTPSDNTVTPIALAALIEEFLKNDTVPGGIRGIIVTTPIPHGRIGLGAQVVQAIVDKGFVAGEGEDKYANVILTGTKADEADEEDQTKFMAGTDGGKSVRELFFKLAVPPGKGPAVMVSKEDYAPLVEAIKALPVVSIRYKPPKAKVMALALAETLEVNVENLEEELDRMRNVVRNKSAQIPALLQRMHKAEHREEMCSLEAELQRTTVEQLQQREETQREMQRRDAAAREQQEEVPDQNSTSSVCARTSSWVLGLTLVCKALMLPWRVLQRWARRH